MVPCVVDTPGNGCFLGVFHREAVESLLRYEASAVVADKKGCYALHLAAWNGHAQICHILLSQGPSLAKPNLQVCHISSTGVEFKTRFLLCCVGGP